MATKWYPFCREHDAAPCIAVPIVGPAAGKRSRTCSCGALITSSDQGATWGAS